MAFDYYINKATKINNSTPELHSFSSSIKLFPLVLLTFYNIEYKTMFDLNVGVIH